MVVIMQNMQLTEDEIKCHKNKKGFADEYKLHTGREWRLKV